MKDKIYLEDMEDQRSEIRNFAELIFELKNMPRLMVRDDQRYKSAGSFEKSAVYEELHTKCVQNHVQFDKVLDKAKDFFFEYVFSGDIFTMSKEDARKRGYPLIHPLAHYGALLMLAEVVE